MEQKTINTTMEPAVVYDFTAAQGFETEQGLTLRNIADSLRDAALRLVNANWDAKNREELIYNMQVATTDALDFFKCIEEREVQP